MINFLLAMTYEAVARVFFPDMTDDAAHVIIHERVWVDFGPHDHPGRITPDKTWIVTQKFVGAFLADAELISMEMAYSKQLNRLYVLAPLGERGSR